MTLDELLLEWSYRSDRGYPSTDNPSDVLLLKDILRELKLPEGEIDDLVDDLEDEPGGDDLTHHGTDGMEDSSIETEKEKEKERQSQQTTPQQTPQSSEISQEKQDLIDILDDTKEPVLKLSSDELEQISIKINMSDENPNLAEAEDDDTIEDTEDGLIQQIKNAKLPPEVLKRMSAELLGDKLGSEIKAYFGAGGKALLQDEVFGVAFNTMKETGDIIKFVKYIKNPMSFREAYPMDTGNLISPFEKIFTTIFLQRLLTLDKGYSGISVGKGEYFLTLLCSDVSFDSPYEVQGDLVWGKMGMEVKNAGAKPTGQKATYGPNSHDGIFTNALRWVKKSSDDPIFKEKGKEIPTSKFSNMRKWRNAIKGRWPYKIAALYEILSNENKSDFLKQVDIDFLNAYKKLPNVKNLSFFNFIEGGIINASRWELEWSRTVVEDYQKAHNFDFVLFLNAKEGKGGYELMSASKVNPNLGLKGSDADVHMWAQDGLPRWTAASVR